MLLNNSSADDGLQQIAQHRLDPRFSLPNFDHAPTVQLSAALLLFAPATNRAMNGAGEPVNRRNLIN